MDVLTITGVFCKKDYHIFGKFLVNVRVKVRVEVTEVPQKSNNVVVAGLGCLEPF